MSEAFINSARFEYRRRLGAGAFGVVYEAYDRERESAVALKVLRSADSGALFLFKREFRALADLNHRNLITLYELFADDSQCYFTMELLEGRRFTSYAWSAADTLSSHDYGSATETTAFTPGLSSPLPLVSRPAVPRNAVDYEKLRDALHQLAVGLNALHGAGKLHRDIKPSNVMVTLDGRVVLLDFGLVTDVPGAGVLDSDGGRIVGTPAYMSPEQAAGRPVSPASDWYGVGVMLYEVLTSQLPFTGSSRDILTAKQVATIPPLHLDFADIPEDLSDLCNGLLRQDPRDRISGHDVVARLKIADSPASPRVVRQQDSQARASFVGRDRELALLHDAYADLANTAAISAYVHGVSGMGKTTLVRRFLHELREREPQVVILSGRCYQQESVPYKAFDPLVDEMSQWLASLPHATVEALLPRDVAALVRLFPVLNRLPTIQKAVRRARVMPDPQEVRRRAVSAFHELLARIAERWPLVLFVDDLHWSDHDSTQLIADIFRGPDPPRVLLIATYRSDETETSPALRELLALHAAGALAPEVRDIALDDLTAQQVASVVRSVAGLADVPADVADLVHRESGGNPFFVQELARLALDSNTTIKPGDLSLEAALTMRLAALPAPAGRLMKVLALAGCPLPLRAARQAADLGRSDYDALTLLRVAQLIRTRETDRAKEIEIYHDRIRGVVAAQIADDEAITLHGRLARALEDSGIADPEALAMHFSKAGEIERAAGHAAVAADRALAALAFDRAARLYELALSLAPADDRAPLRFKRAEALANAGRGSLAAQAYLEAAQDVDATTFIELQRRAAEQFLISGYIDEGLAALENVLRTQGLRLAPTPQWAMIQLGLRRVLIRLRGLDLREADVSTIAPAQLLRIDVCWSVAIGLAFVDNIRAAEFQSRHFVLALRCGEPRRAARALALEAGYSATGGTRTERRTKTVARAAIALAERLQDPPSVGLALLAAGVAAHLEGRWQASLQLCERAEKILRESCTGVTWEIDTAGVHILDDLLSLGDLNALVDRVELLVKNARTRGDLYGETAFRLRAAYITPLMRDDPAAAIEGLEAAEAAWTRRGFMLQHYWGLMARLDVLAYQGKGAEALELITRQWPRLKSAQLLRVQFSRVQSHYRRGRSALLAAVDLQPGSRQRSDLLHLVRKDARQLKREGAVWSVGLGNLLEAGVAAVDHSELEEVCLRRAEECFTDSGMALHASTCRVIRGRRSGADRGALASETAQWFTDHAIANVEAFGQMIAGRRGEVSS